MEKTMQIGSIECVEEGTAGEILILGDNGYE